MIPDALAYLALVVFVVVPLVVAFVALARIRNAAEAARMAEALWPDPAKTAGGAVGKRWDTYAGQTNVVSQSYTGGCGDQLYPVDVYDHHTLDAIYASEQGEEIVRTETLP